jgi:hypothetical protein
MICIIPYNNKRFSRSVVWGGGLAQHPLVRLGRRLAFEHRIWETEVTLGINKKKLSS